MDKHYFKGLDSFAQGTYDCDGYNGSCLYNQDGRCIYTIAPIQQSQSRSCYEDIRMADILAGDDYYDLTLGY